ncbi:MAG: cytochrome c biogenesis protein ResB [Gemmataceae bacterium]|nr:cytochrome c biogenesis protein ResB [Gemmataceae bacterium]MCI0742156.1 cytochrome c biogenesis protein ResB [Gemmataceae bacterium]
MSSTATQPGPAPASLKEADMKGALVPGNKPRAGLAWRILQICASLRVTVVLFVLSFLLVFWGTWAQRDESIWSVVNSYFRWWFVWIPLKPLTLELIDLPVYIPFPGGWTIGSLLMINLLAAHAVRFKLTWKRSGIILLHSGIVLMMLGEFVAAFQIEGRMSIPEGHSSSHIESDKNTELAIVRRLSEKEQEETLIPGSRLQYHDRKPIQDAQLPFDVEVERYLENSDLRSVEKTSQPNPATVGIGLRQVAVAKSKVSGTDPNQAVEIASAYVTLKKKGTGESLGTYLVSTWFSFLLIPAEMVTVDGKKYEISLRYQREYKPYTIHLTKFTHDKYIGTETPKNFQSDVRLVDPANNVDRAVKIYMNNPLRYEGETFYQASLYPMGKGTVLQVVRNPGWLMPYFSTAMVTLGMLVHFGIMLVNFIIRRLA